MMRGGLAVFGACILASIVVAFALKARYKDELLGVQDLTTGLIYFIEASGGRFPASRDEFAASPFVETLPDGALRVRGRPESSYRRESHGYPLRDLERFRVAWGADLEQLDVDEKGKVRDAAGQKVELVCWPSSPPSGNEYSRLLLEVSRRERALATVPSPR